MMNLLLYATITDGAGARLQRVVEGLVPREKTKICRTIESLTRRLRQPSHDLSIAVLLATNQKELFDLLSLRDLFADIRIILVLPDKKRDTIAKGHSLQPRFLTYADSNFAAVAAVLSKMLGNNYLRKIAAGKGDDL
ncbi:MAG: hypothetical protein JRI58_08215 [Deltaproteobacteria bacterium]|nr:hypothetical protein [Deltaproteobacteria bacterium]MBW2074715.1 hypothetical protein [Deltaproteobacteria bacterium]RLB79720.1 MAG: hypothetical protein DRH17_13320 [Deltaproteobacteria bacterium]